MRDLESWGGGQLRDATMVRERLGGAEWVPEPAGGQPCLMRKGSKEGKASLKWAGGRPRTGGDENTGTRKLKREAQDRILIWIQKLIFMSIWEPKSAAAKDNEDDGGGGEDAAAADDVVVAVIASNSWHLLFSTWNRLSKSLIKTLLYDPHLMGKISMQWRALTRTLWVKQPDRRIGAFPREGNKWTTSLGCKFHPLCSVSCNNSLVVQSRSKQKRLGLSSYDQEPNSHQRLKQHF